MEEEEASSSSSSAWSREQEKAFEDALVDYPEDCADRWEKISAAVGGKTEEDVKCHYELLVEDLEAIGAGQVPLPNYLSGSEGSGEHGSGGKKGGNSHGESSGGGKVSKAEQERRKGIAWTEEEHRMFLLGLDKYGKGDWRSISRNFVISRTPTQVASHAQKYFIRLSSMNKDRRRTSIHDITSVGAGDISATQGPITGQVSGPSPMKSAKQSSQAPGSLGVGIYGTTIGQPVGGHLVSAVGTPVILPVPAAPHMAYGIRAPVPGAVVSGAPVNLGPMTYPMPPRTSSALR